MPRTPRRLPAQNTLSYLLLTLTALCGEYPISQISRLPGGPAYLESMVTSLRQSGLLHTFSKDGLRGLRLTSPAKRLLLADAPQWFSDYDWFIHPRINCHGTQVVTYDNSLLYPIISNNHFNSEPEQWHCSQCKTFDWLNGSYIEYVKEEDFLLNPSMYVENAYTKSQNGGAGYRLQRTRKN